MIDRKAGLVLARHGSGPLPIDAVGEHRTLALFEAIRARVG